MAQYEVVVGGTRTMYRGSDRAMAAALASEYRQKRQHTTLKRDGQVLMEVYGDMSAAQGEVYQGCAIRSWRESKVYVARAFVAGHLLRAEAASRRAAVSAVKRMIDKRSAYGSRRRGPARNSRGRFTRGR